MTVLGGYLGAGKTTLLNDLLARGSPDERVAVVVNDFGAVNVDAALVRSRSADTLELANGCVCCSMRDGMADVMERLRTLRPAPARVLLEVSGVGDPAAVAGWGDHPGFVRHGVVVCADAVGVRALARDRWVADTVVHQLAGADVVLLTKLDLVDPDEARAVRDWVATTADRALVLDDRDELAELLHRGVPRRVRVADPDRPSPAGDRHTATHTAWSLALERPPGGDVLRRILAGLPGPVVRVKGVLQLADRPGRRTVVQLAAGRVTLEDDGRWDEAPDAGALVVITRGPATADAGAGAPEAEIVLQLRGELGACRP